MTRLNVDGWTITSDSRFAVLAKLYPYDPADSSGFVPGRHHARGVMECAWFECLMRQTNQLSKTEFAFCTEQPEHRIEQLFDALQKSGLGTRVDTRDEHGNVENVFVVLRGCKDRNEWLEEIREKRSRAGKASGKARRKKSNKQTNTCSENAEQKTNPHALALSHAHVQAQALVNSLSVELEEIYSHYPKKQGKAKGLATAKARIKSAEDLERLRAFVLRMEQDWQGHDKTYCPLWSTFINQERWRDEDPLRPRTAAGITRTGRPDGMGGHVYQDRDFPDGVIDL